MTIGIYKITEHETGRCYIGQSKNIEKRWKAHRGKRGKFPASAFDYEILQATSVEQLNEAEIKFIDFFDSHRNGFNKTIGGTDIKILFPDEETKEKRRKSMMGKNVGKNMSEETKRLLSEVMTGKPGPNKGKTFSEEERRNMSESHKGFKVSPETIEKIRKFRLNRPYEIVDCPHCDKRGGVNNMYRWHFNNCKKKEI